MYSNFKEQAIEYVKQAVEADNSGNYYRAFPLYMNALEYFKAHLKYEKDPRVRDAITTKFTEYLRRAEELRAVLDDKPLGTILGDHAYNNKTNYKDEANKSVNQAVQEDGAGNYAKAFPLYVNALDYFGSYLKYGENINDREAVSAKVNEHLRRAIVDIQTLLDEGGEAGTSSTSPP